MTGSLIALMVVGVMAVIAVAHRRGIRVPAYAKYVEHRLRLSPVAAAVEGGAMFAATMAALFFLEDQSIGRALLLGVLAFAIFVPLYIVARRRLDDG